MGTSSSNTNNGNQKPQKSTASKYSKQPQIQITSELEDKILGTNKSNFNPFNTGQTPQYNPEGNLFMRDNRRKVKDIPENIKNKAILINQPTINIDNFDIENVLEEEEKSIGTDLINQNQPQIENQKNLL